MKRFLFSFLTLGALALPCAAASLSLPPTLRGETFLSVTVSPKTDAASVRYVPLTPGLKVLDREGLDPRKCQVTAKKPGTYTLMAFAGDANGPSEAQYCDVTFVDDVAQGPRIAAGAAAEAPKPAPRAALAAPAGIQNAPTCGAGGCYGSVQRSYGGAGCYGSSPAVYGAGCRGGAPASYGAGGCTGRTPQASYGAGGCSGGNPAVAYVPVPVQQPAMVQAPAPVVAQQPVTATVETTTVEYPPVQVPSQALVPVIVQPRRTGLSGLFSRREKPHWELMTPAATVPGNCPGGRCPAP